MTIEYLFDKYFGPMLLFGRNIFTGDFAIVEDSVMIVFGRLIDKVGGFKTEISVRQWLYTSLKNELVNQGLHVSNRKGWTEKAEFQESELYLEQNIIKVEVIRLIAEAIEKLPIGRRTIIKKLYYEKFTHKECAEHLHISVNTVRNQKMEALKTLKALLPNHYKEALAAG